MRLNYRPVVFSDTIPYGWERYYLPGAERLAYEGPAGFILAQTVLLSPILFQYLIITPGTAGALNLQFPVEGFNVWISMRGQWEIRSGAVQMPPLNTHEVSAACGLPVELNSFLEAGSDMVLLHFSYPVTEALQWMGHQSANPTEDRWAPKAIDLELLDLVDHLLHTGFQPPLRPFHARLCWDLLTGVRRSFQKQQKADGAMDSQLIEQVSRVKMYMDLHPDQHVSVAAFADMVSVNRQKLQMGFRQLVGMGIYAYDLHRRMELARQLLMSTKLPIKQIARRCRYKNASGFVSAFIKSNAVTPTQYRRLNAQ